MDKENRARQFMPFDALKGFREALGQKEKDLLKVERHETTREHALYLEAKLSKIRKGNKIKITYYDNGFYLTKIGLVSLVDYVNSKIIINKNVISFNDILKINPIKKNSNILIQTLLILTLPIVMVSGCVFPNNSNQSSVATPNETEENIEIIAYVDGLKAATFETNDDNDYKISEPVLATKYMNTGDPSSNEYFYGWFLDEKFNQPLLSDYQFKNDSEIFSKIINKYSLDVKYTINNGNATITSIGESGDRVIIVPDYINGFPVVELANEIFKDRVELTEVIISNGIKKIGDMAFYGCEALTKVSMPDSIVSIGLDAFHGCSSLVDVNIPENLTTIPNNAFINCKSLKSIMISNSVTNIGSGAFYNCELLTDVVIPDSVIKIGTNAFYNCDSLESIKCEATTKPEGWGDSWNAGCSAEVIWDYQK